MIEERAEQEIMGGETAGSPKQVKKTQTASGKKNLVVFFVTTIGLLVLVLSALQTLVLSGNTRKSVSGVYTESSSEITTAYSLALANKIMEYAGLMELYTSADHGICRSDGTVYISRYRTDR
jgi:hypothetical protein